LLSPSIQILDIFDIFQVVENKTGEYKIDELSKRCSLVGFRNKARTLLQREKDPLFKVSH
jgi:hypothetical protein